MNSLYDFGNETINRILNTALYVAKLDIAYNDQQQLGVVFTSKWDNKEYWIFPKMDKEEDIINNWLTELSKSAQKQIPGDVAFAYMKAMTVIYDALEGVAHYPDLALRKIVQESSGRIVDM